jgi:hypothetical protein
MELECSQPTGVRDLNEGVEATVEVHADPNPDSDPLRK